MAQDPQDIGIVQTQKRKLVDYIYKMATPYFPKQWTEEQCTFETKHFLNKILEACQAADFDSSQSTVLTRIASNQYQHVIDYIKLLQNKIRPTQKDFYYIKAYTKGFGTDKVIKTALCLTSYGMRYAVENYDNVERVFTPVVVYKSEVENGDFEAEMIDGALQVTKHKKDILFDGDPLTEVVGAYAKVLYKDGHSEFFIVDKKRVKQSYDHGVVEFTPKKYNKKYAKYPESDHEKKEAYRKQLVDEQNQRRDDNWAAYVRRTPYFLMDKHTFQEEGVAEIDNLNAGAYLTRYENQEPEHFVQEEQQKEAEKVAVIEEDHSKPLNIPHVKLPPTPIVPEIATASQNEESDVIRVEYEEKVVPKPEQKAEEPAAKPEQKVEKHEKDDAFPEIPTKKGDSPDNPFEEDLNL